MLVRELHKVCSSTLGKLSCLLAYYVGVQILAWLIILFSKGPPFSNSAKRWVEGRHYMFTFALRLLQNIFRGALWGDCVDG